ncbi:ketopantoate hydroxymethyltransferase [Brevibacterium iodinum ATCC 49514]|uniref:3-methyl-2-oxobutanoate hydroxymethyltransferase n=1 Tax=Brevibacterium iodinum ATCC 49514 TaxID=1255616 RepID=A0A2H1HNI7_9MICO|nr:3-methyl-2-oxobutanoate hydroxymethyltransferase [Brevibacterium iodinum]SMX64454.1 ketopantoate hydroxymethyltransferase [Brevibacterium iodinum ATCC 49514]SUW13342.1 3-methyl-2-oxobutanoate hydroxymethyltransferase [Brevibacterium iodinum]
MPEAAHSNQFTSSSATDAAGNAAAGGNAPAGPNATASPGATAGAASAEQPAPYGGPVSAPAAPPRRIRTLDLIKAKAEGRRWAMLTSYDQYTAALFEQAGVEALLIGDSAANNVYGHATTLPVTVDELIPLARAVASATSRALIVADLPFGSYEISDEQAVAMAVRFMKEAGVHAVKLEGGARMASRIKAITTAGIPVMAHIGFTPQAEHNLGGYKVQGRGDAGGALLDDARAVAEAGAFSVVMEMVPSGLAGQVTSELTIPTVGIGAGADCDAQVLVWQDMAGLRTGRAPRFVKRYADLHSVLTEAVGTYVDEVKSGVFPEPERSFD